VISDGHRAGAEFVSTAAEPGVEGRAARVVVCDDLPEFRALMCAGLEDDSSLRVVGEAGTGDEAIERVVSEQADVVMLDLSIPGRSGLKTIPLRRARVRREGRSVGGHPGGDPRRPARTLSRTWPAQVLSR
jgi:CheY-like chemotaxis protein